MKKYLVLFALLLCIPLTMAAQEVTVTGTVTDAESGETLIGVNITVKDVPGLGTITDADGKYSRM